MHGSSRGPTGLIDRIEQTGIAAIIGVMTLLTFANVIARYVFNSNILWALETTVFLFAWLVLLGAAHGVKISGHIGVDLLLNLANAKLRRIMILFSVACCVAFSAMLLYGSWEYWWPFASKRAWYEVNDIPMPGILQFIAVLLNDGEAYEKMPRFIPYAALPVGVALLMFRFLQAGWQILTGTREMIIASHEVEEQLANTEGQN